MKTKSSSQSAFFYPRLLVGVLFCFAGVALAFFAFRSASAQGTPQPVPVKGQYRGLAPVVRFDISPPLRNIKSEPFYPGQLRENEDRDILPWKYILGLSRFIPDADPVVQSRWGGIEVPGPIVSFDGPPNVSGVAPPDPNGEVGPNHVVVMSNLSFQIFNKTGTSLFGPALNKTLWAGFGGPCQNENAGDPVILYDQLADRWLLSQFTSAGPNYFNCVAISTTPDPTGTYFRYAIGTGTNFPDYPKYGIWPNAFFISTREFTPGGAFAGVGAYALNRPQALAGNPAAQVISFLVPPGGTPYNLGDGLLPSDLDGFTLPPTNSPNFYVGSMDNNGPYGAPQDALTLWKFVADFGNPPASSFTLTNTIPVAPFNSILGLCGGSRSCIPQPSTASRIDHLGYRQRPLHRLAYRNFGSHESLVTNQSVSAGVGPNGEVSGIRWWELRNPNGAPTIFQQGTYAPGLTDGIHRWMGSMAMDSAGNIALGYSASNNTNPAVFPSVFYTGRAEFDPAGQLPRGEGSIINGTGSQTGGGSRWGDYTALSVDPTDDLTFWYVNEWIPTTSSAGWRLRIGAFRLSTAPVPTSAVSVKTHGGAGTFPIALPLVPVHGAVGIEPRLGPVAGEYEMVVTFPTPVSVAGAAVTTGTGSATFSVAGNVVMVHLTGVTDVQRIAVTLSNVNDGTNFGNVVIPMGVLGGDVNQSGNVAASDIGQTKANAGGPVNGTTFTSDVNANGAINASDIGLVKSKSGNVLPP